MTPGPPDVLAVADDTPELLRRHASAFDYTVHMRCIDTMHKAADQIERLRAVVARVAESEARRAGARGRRDPVVGVGRMIGIVDPSAKLTLKKLRELGDKAKGDEWFVEHAATADGLSRIDDGCQYGMFPIYGEAHEIEFAAACVNFVRRLLEESREPSPTERGIDG